MTFPPLNFVGRLDGLCCSLDEVGIDSLVVTSSTNIRYLTGFTGSAADLVVDKNGALLITDGRYREQAPEQVESSGVSVSIVGSDRRSVLRRSVMGAKRVGLEADSVSWAEQLRFLEWLDTSDLIPVDGVVERFREVKDFAEVERLEAAASLADSVLQDVTDLLVVGISEQEMAEAIDHGIRSRGAEDRAFATIVAFCSNSALPHARPTGRSLVEDDLVVCDFGAVVEGYRSDMTRSFYVGESIGKYQSWLRNVVLEAQNAGLSCLADGVPAAKVDAACRDVLTEAGLADAFVHGTGHGVGLDIHEAPAISSSANGTLRSGHVVTVEPGAYCPGVGGVRWEDTVLITTDGYRALTRAPKADQISSEE